MLLDLCVWLEVALQDGLTVTVDLLVLENVYEHRVELFTQLLRLCVEVLLDVGVQAHRDHSWRCFVGVNTFLDTHEYLEDSLEGNFIHIPEPVSWN